MTLPIFTPKVLTPDPDTWQQPWNAGNTGGPSTSTPHGTYVIGADDEGNLRVDMYPVPAAPGQNWDTYYFFNELELVKPRVGPSLEIAFMFPTDADIAACQAFEWEAEYCENGDVWNCGWQALPSSDGKSIQIRVFDDVSQDWINAPGDPFMASLQAGKWVQIVTEHEINPDSEKHVAIWIDGKRFPVNRTQSVVRGKWPAGTNYLHAAFQFDSKGQGVPFKAVVAGPTVTVR